MTDSNRALIWLVVACLLQSCGSKDAGGPKASEDPSVIATGAMHSVRRIEEKYEVTYHDDVVIIANEAMQHMSPIIDDYLNLEFAIAAKPHLDLEQGKVTIFPLAALGRVVSWQESGDTISVQLEPAMLTEAIKDADIESLLQIRWSELGQQTASNNSYRAPTFALFNEAVAADSDEIEREIKIKKKLEDIGLEFALKLKPGENELKFELEVKASKKAYRKSVTREQAAARFANERVNAGNSQADYYNYNEFQPVTSEGAPGAGNEADSRPDGPGSASTLSAGLVGEIKGVVKFTGFISNINQAIDIEIADSQTTKFQFDLKNLEGQVKIESAALDGLLGVFNLKVPLEYSIPARIGLIPITLKLGTEFSFRPILELGTGGSSKICFLVEWKGSSGFSFENGSFANKSSPVQRDMATCGETVSAGRLTVGLGATVKFPQIKLEMFGKLIVPEFYAMADGVTTYEPGIASALPACQAGKVSVAAIFKASLDFFGLAGIETQSKLWSEEKEWTCDQTVRVKTFDRAGGEKVEETAL